MTNCKVSTITINAWLQFTDSMSTDILSHINKQVLNKPISSRKQSGNHVYISFWSHHSVLLDFGQTRTMAQRASLARGGKHIVQDPTQCPPGIDTTTYFSPSIPLEVKAAIPLFHLAPHSIVVGLLKSALAYQQHQQPARFQLDPSLYHPQQQTNNLSPEDLNTLLTALYFITRSSIRNKVKISVIQQDLLKMNVPKEVVDVVVQSIGAQRLAIEDQIISHRVQFNKLEKVRWRMDVIISSGTLSRVMRPSILMQVSLVKFVCYVLRLKQCMHTTLSQSLS
jgi:hypothetical protein